jgi:uncharacterized membrane protein YfcA
MGFEFFLFMGVGFLAQIVDGALGMAYGVISSSVLLAFGVPPAHASASVHAAEVFTTAASATSHMAHRNVDWKLFWRLAPAGIVGGVLGAYVLTSIESQVLRPYITAYLTIMGLYILYRAWRKRLHTVSPNAAIVAPLGVVGGFVDATGGGGWGPVVTTTLVGSGGVPRYVIGTVSAVEFFLTTAVSIAFLAALLSGHWQEAGAFADHAGAVAGLIVGGVLAAPFAGFIARHVQTRPLMVTVGLLVIALGVFQMWQMLAG